MRGRLARSVYDALELDADQLDALGQSDSKYGEYRAVKTVAVQSISESVLARGCVTDQESRARALRVVADNDDLRASAVVRLLGKLVVPIVPLVDEAAVCRALCDRMVELVAFHAAAMSCGGNDLMDTLERDQRDAFRAEFERHASPCSSGGRRQPHASAIDRPIPTVGPRSSGGGGSYSSSGSGALPRQRFQQLRTAAGMVQRTRSSPGALVLDEALACNFVRSESACAPALTGRDQQRPQSGGGSTERPPRHAQIASGHLLPSRPQSATPSLCLPGHQRQQAAAKGEEESTTSAPGFSRTSVEGSAGSSDGSAGSQQAQPWSHPCQQGDPLQLSSQPHTAAVPWSWWGPTAPLTAYMMQRSGSWQAQPQLCAPSEWGCGRMWSSSSSSGGGVTTNVTVAAAAASAAGSQGSKRSSGGGAGGSSSNGGRGGGGSGAPSTAARAPPSKPLLVTAAPPLHLQGGKTVLCIEVQDRVAVMLRQQLDTVRGEARNPDRNKGGGSGGVSLLSGAMVADEGDGE